MIDPKFDHCRPLRYTLLAVDLALITYLLWYVVAQL